MNTVYRQTHLEYYCENQIAPVHYDQKDLDAHLSRRSFLYTKLGLPPIAFQEAKVLEVAAGTGQNSLYPAQLNPSQLTLVEPNPTGIKKIRDIYQNFEKPHTKPQIIFSTLEEYTPLESFDIVICENWLGTSKHEISLLQKLSDMVSKRGVLVLTAVSPIGFVPNLLRRYLTTYITSFESNFEDRTNSLIKAYETHLNTMSAMTRNCTDWIHDNMMNPAFFGVCLNIPTIIQQLGDRFEILGSCPSLAEDWRWFKSAYGEYRQLNENFLSEYWLKAHNFLDYREKQTKRDPLSNVELEHAAVALLKAIEDHENTYVQNGDIINASLKVREELENFLSAAPIDFVMAIRGLQEFMLLLDNPKEITVENVANMKYFNSLFGRETSYASFMRSTS